MPHNCNLFIQTHPDLGLIRRLNVVDEFKSAKSGPTKSGIVRNSGQCAHAFGT